MNLLISPDQTIELAFCPHDQIDPAVLTDTRIEAAQLKFLKPALGRLYTALTEGKHDDFCRTYIKPALAYFVRYHVFLHLSVRVGSEGIIRLQPVEGRPAEDVHLARLRRESRHTAYLLLGEAFDYLNGHAEEFPEFDPCQRRGRRPRISGGIVI